MQDRLLIDTARLDAEGEVFEGEADIIDLDEELVRPFGGVRYKLTAQAFGTEVLVRGHLEQDFDLVCCRCGKDFDTTVKVDDFTASFTVDEKTLEIDVSDEARESVILALPTYPVCEASCEGVPQTREVASDARWGALDKVRV